MLNTVESLLNAMSKIAPMAIPCASTKVGGWWYFKAPVLQEGVVLLECVQEYHEAACTGVQELRDALSEFEPHVPVKILMVLRDTVKIKNVKRGSGSAILMVA